MYKLDSSGRKHDVVGSCMYMIDSSGLEHG